MQTGNGIIIFDGYCNFCSRSVLFILKRARHACFIFASSRESAGKKLLNEYGIKKAAAHSIILIEEGRIFVKSDAALRIARRFRDYINERISSNRYRLFGIRGSCFLSPPEYRNRFLDG